LLLFFIVNAAVSLADYFHMVIGSGALNPYIYQGQYQKYFINTGDKIRGISFDTSTTNAVLNSIGVIYFLHRKKIIMMLICMVILLLTTSNITNFLITGILLYLFVFQTDRIQKSLILVCLTLLLIFIIKISPQNNKYTLEAIQRIFNKKTEMRLSPVVIPLRERPDSLLTSEKKKQKIAQLYLDSLARNSADQKKSL